MYEPCYDFLNDFAYGNIKQDILKSYNIKNGIDDFIKSPKVFFTDDDIYSDREKMYNPQSDSYIPFKYVQFEDGDVYFHSISEYSSFAREFYKEFAGDLFSGNALNYLYKALGEKVKDYKLKPYIQNYDEEKYLLTYGMSDKSSIAFSKIKPSTVQFKCDTTYENKTGAYEGYAPDGIYYGTLVGNDIVCIVGSNNEICPEIQGNVVGIGVETHKDYRLKGYALSNIAAMCDYLISNRQVVKYYCNSKNLYSIKTAIASGFKAVAREKTFYCVNTF